MWSLITKIWIWIVQVFGILTLGVRPWEVHSWLSMERSIFESSGLTGWMLTRHIMRNEVVSVHTKGSNSYRSSKVVYCKPICISIYHYQITSILFYIFFLQTGDICKDDLKKIKAKTLIIHGIKDPLVPLEHPDYLHHHIKGSRYHYPTWS